MSIARTYLTNDIAFSWAINPLVIPFPFLPESDAKQSRVSTMTNRAELFLAAARRLTVCHSRAFLFLSLYLFLHSASKSSRYHSRRTDGGIAAAENSRRRRRRWQRNTEIIAKSVLYLAKRSRASGTIPRAISRVSLVPSERGYYPAIGATKIYVVSIDEEASLFFLSLPPSLPHGSTVPVLSLSFCTRSCQLYLAGHRVISH